MRGRVHVRTGATEVIVSERALPRMERVNWLAALQRVVTLLGPRMKNLLVRTWQDPLATTRAK